MSLEVIRDGQTVPMRLRRGVVAAGLFDGVHRGHRQVIDRARDLADRRDVACGVLTFDRHPATVVHPESAPRVLTTLRQRLDLFEALGVDFVRVVTFDDDRSLQSAEDFVATVVRDELAAALLVVGEGFHFGLRRRGDVLMLSALAPSMDFEVEVVALAADGDLGPLSSRRIRECLAAGDVQRASLMLGRDHEVRGIVEHGDERGRTLGFPTANVAVGGDVMLPADGVYAATYLTPDGVERPAAVSIGRRPTFYRDNGLLLVEAFLLDFDGDLYGQRATVRVSQFIRGQERFASAEELVDQMNRDVVAIRLAIA